MHEHKLCVLVLMDILFRTKEAKVVASDMLPRLNYYKNTLAAGSVKYQITLQKISPVEGAFEWFSAGWGQNLKPLYCLSIIGKRKYQQICYTCQTRNCAELY